MISIQLCYALIYGSCALGIIYAVINYLRVRSISLKEHTDFEMGTMPRSHDEEISLDRHRILAMVEIGEIIAKGANTFLYQEYIYLSIYCLVFSVVVWFASDSLGLPFTTLAFVAGAVTSILSGFIGMRIAVISNYRTTYEARKSLASAFKVAFRAGCVMGFALTSLALLVLVSLIAIYRVITDLSVYSPDAGELSHKTAELYEQIAGYGLGGSTIALFSRVGGGIYTKAADVGADLVGKLENDLAEDSPKNPATIADNVGDNVGDIAGMGADLFGSFAESTSAALVILANDLSFRQQVSQVFDIDHQDTYLFFPLLISAFGIICCLVCSLAATDIMSVDKIEDIDKTLRWQLIISTILLIGGIYLASALTLDFHDEFIAKGAKLYGAYRLNTLNAFICAATGLVAGFVIGNITEYYTSNAYEPVKEVARSCETGAATNIIYGLALGYKSTIIPILSLAIACFISHRVLGMLGVSIAALGMLSNLCVGLAIDAYGPICDNAGGIAEMAQLGEHVRERTDALDAAGNTTAAIGKGFAIGSAALVSLALYGAFITRAGTNPGRDVNVIQIKREDVYVADAMVFSGLLIGAMLPYWFSALTMKSVGSAAKDMVNEVRRQLREDPRIKTGESTPDYERCVAISTQSALREMIAPGALVILAPLITGVLFGPKAVAGLLPGILISGVQMAVSASNTGGAWDNAKKYIESGQLIFEGSTIAQKKGSEAHRAAVVGDTVGDPLKDTSGPSINILVKLSAILSLVFTTFFQRTGYLVCMLEEEGSQLPRCQPHYANVTNSAEALYQ